MCDAPGRTSWLYTALLCTFFWAVTAKQGQDLSKPGEIAHFWHEEWPGSAAYTCHQLVTEEQPYSTLALPTHLRKPTSLYGHSFDAGRKSMGHATHHLHSIVVDRGTDHLEALIYNRHMTLREDLLRNAIANLGDPSRMQALFRKLLRGEPITMVALGGSITCGAGARDVPSYIEQVFEWINSTFPHPQHTFINSCKGGEGSTAAGLCFDAKVPRNADFITMEFTLNDADTHVPFAVDYLHSTLAWPRDMQSDKRMGFEVLLRNALLHPNQPALLYIHEWVAPFEGFSFWLSQEADMSTFLDYYRIPELSMRRALYRDTMEGTVGFRPEEQICDMMHPNNLGHRYYADVMVAFLQDHAWAAATGPPTGTPAAPPYPPPAPLIPNNYEHGQQCAINEALITLVQPSQGWEWVDEGKLGHRKLGWRSVTPGSKLITKPIDTTSTVQNTSEPVLLILGILKSYEHMGRAVLACESGCTCKPLNFDSHHAIKESVTKQVYHLVSQSPMCVVSVTVLETTSSSEHKVKIDMLGVSTTVNATRWVADHSFYLPGASWDY